MSHSLTHTSEVNAVVLHTAWLNSHQSRSTILDSHAHSLFDYII